MTTTEPGLRGAAVLAALAAGLLATQAGGAAVFGLDTGYPGPAPGPMRMVSEGTDIVTSNAALAVAWTVAPGGPRARFFRDAQSGLSVTPGGELFQIVLSDGRSYPASALVPEARPRTVRLPADPHAPRLAARVAGRKLEVALRTADGRLGVVWRVVARDGANYVRQELEVSALTAGCVTREIVWLPGAATGARTVGSVEGSPAVAEPFFYGCEDPHARSEGGSFRLRREAPLREGETLTQSLVIGVAPAGQMRRGFLYYLERERAHPYRPFLHYNSWYDIAWEPFALNETNCLEAIRLLGERFIRPHQVVLDAVVFDDGWDNPKSLWQFHAGFPRGFTPLAGLCRDYGTRLGVWLSPFGGYGEPRNQRLQFGSAQGFETNRTGFSLAGPRYYAAFRQACREMIRRFGVNHFKFDGIAAGMYADGSAEYTRDTEAMRRLMLDLRRDDPNLYLNLTTGSWPSPFWLRYADSVWRQGGDMGQAGKGPTQQQWLTYRDQETCRNIVRKGPLFPLNSLMTQGVAYSRHGMAGDPTFTSAGFKDDVRGFFGSGTSLQELYIQPGKLTDDDWRVLAEAARWSRANADVLVDTHWLGGDPGRLQVYGYASWSARKGIVMLRNPDDRPQTFALDLATAFELPAGATRSFLLRSPWAEDAGQSALAADASKPVNLGLGPFEVRILEATPASVAPSEPTPQASVPALVPRPSRLQVTGGGFRFTARTVVVPAPDARNECRQLAASLRVATGLPLPLGRTGRAADALVIQKVRGLEPVLGPEGYRLSVQPGRVSILAAGDAGIFYAGITLRQLLPAETFGGTASGAGGVREWQIPCVEIEDHPRFVWRGLLLDVARHYLPVEFLRKFVDLAALHKFNRLQLHLTDDQGWRVEIRKYPRLTQVGSVRAESPRKGAPDRGDGRPYGPFFYRQKELRDLVAYAQARHVTLVPEIEMPGHMLSALAAYPGFSCRGGPFAVRTRWGVEPDVLCPGNEHAIGFVKDVLTEIMEIFPSQFIHIGGDEVPRDRWRACARCQALMREKGFAREAQLQTYLNHEVEQFLAQHGRRLLGWDEILEGGLTPGATVMSWRGIEGGLAAANAGHDVVMSPNSHCYLDYAQARGADEPESIGGFIPLDTVYAFEPVPPQLPESRRPHILGGQGNLWTEFMWTPRDVEYFAFPRAVALAEVLWSPAASRDVADFQRRLQVHLQRLDQLGVNYRRGNGPAN